MAIAQSWGLLSRRFQRISATEFGTEAYYVCDASRIVDRLSKATGGAAGLATAGRLSEQEPSTRALAIIPLGPTRGERTERHTHGTQ